MCSNYRPSKPDQIGPHFGVSPTQTDLPLEAWPGYFGYMLRPGLHLHEEGIVCVSACFGVVTPSADPKKAFRYTYNARSESISWKPSYKNAWSNRQFCIIPTESFFEPFYETKNSKPVRWRIEHNKGRTLGVAGIYEWRPDGGPNNGPLESFSMITINAKEHELMSRFHKPDDEKRMIVILDPSQYSDWLTTPLKDAREFLKQYPADQLIAVPDPKPPRTKKNDSTLPKAA